MKDGRILFDNERRGGFCLIMIGGAWGGKKDLVFIFVHPISAISG